MAVHFLDELIATTGHLMSLVYSPRIVHEKQMPMGLNLNNVVTIFLYYDTFDGIAKSVRNKKIPHSNFVIKTLSAGKARCMVTINKKKNNIVSAIVFSLSLHAITHPNVHRCRADANSGPAGRQQQDHPIHFKDRGEHNELTPKDRISLYLLYNTGLTAGIPRVEAPKVIYAKLKKFHSGGI